MPEQKHNRAYHRYFENYAEREVTDSRGRRRIERVYVGQYYRAAVNDGEHRRRKLWIGLSFAAAAALFLWAGLTAPVTGARWVAVLSMLALIAMLLLAVAVCFRLTAPREMEVRAWRDSSERLKLISPAAGALLAADAAAMAADILIRRQSALNNWLGAAATLAAAAAALIPGLIERRTEYTVLPPKHERAEGSSPIRRYAPD